jgi:hypothetical protein
MTLVLACLGVKSQRILEHQCRMTPVSAFLGAEAEGGENPPNLDQHRMILVSASLEGEGPRNLEH